MPAGGLRMKFCHDLAPRNTVAGEVHVEGWGLSNLFHREHKLMHPKEPNRQPSWAETPCDVGSEDLAANPFAKHQAAKCYGEVGGE